jgi:hypothetical protein
VTAIVKFAQPRQYRTRSTKAGREGPGRHALYLWTQAYHKLVKLLSTNVATFATQLTATLVMKGLKSTDASYPMSIHVQVSSLVYRNPLFIKYQRSHKGCLGRRIQSNKGTLKEDLNVLGWRTKVHTMWTSGISCRTSYGSGPKGEAIFTLLN